MSVPEARADDGGKWVLRPADEVIKNLTELATQFVRGEFGSTEPDGNDPTAVVEAVPPKVKRRRKA